MSLEEELNLKAKKYIAMIHQEYREYINPELVNQLLKQEKLVVIEENEMKLKQKQIEEIENDNTISEEIKKKEISNFKIPLAHGGKVFNDRIIHFYPFTTKDSGQVLKETLEGVLIHEIFHYFIAPIVLSNNFQDEKISSYITEGLVDMMCRDFQKNHQIHLNYNSNYENNVLYVRDELQHLPITQKLNMVFHGSIKDFLNINSKGEMYSLERLITFQKEQTPFQQLLSKIAYIPQEHNKSLLKGLKNLAANANSQNEALETIEQNMKFIPQIQPNIYEISQQITNYKKIQAKQQLLEQRKELEERISNKQEKEVPTLSKKNINGFFQGNIILLIAVLCGVLFTWILLK